MEYYSKYSVTHGVEVWKLQNKKNRDSELCKLDSGNVTLRDYEIREKMGTGTPILDTTDTEGKKKSQLKIYQAGLAKNKKKNNVKKNVEGNHCINHEKKEPSGRRLGL